jgi:eukaryotic-like serine/threonine-protein kinase
MARAVQCSLCTMPLSPQHFLQTVEKSGLIAKTRLEGELAALTGEAGGEMPADTQVLSAHLTRRGLLTNWQSERLLEGRHRGFFLGKYKLLDHLGTGGMSAVYLAEHIVMRRRVAIKVLPLGRLDDSSYLRRFHREARAVAALDHPNIVRAFDVDHDGETHYLVMEYVPGRDLKRIVEQDGPLPPDKAADYIRQAAEGLAHAHAAGLVHRDMKPANLLVDHRGTVKVLDLGLASMIDDVDAALSKEFDDTVLGTVDYLAPEQAVNSQTVDGRADIYSLGCTLYFILTGHPPFPTGTLAQRIMMHQLSEPASITVERPSVPAGLVAICGRMMAKDVKRRYQTAGEVSQAMMAWLRSPPPADRPATKVRKPTPGSTGDDDLRLLPLKDEAAAKLGQQPRPSNPKPRESKRESAKPPKPASAKLPGQPAAKPSAAADRWEQLLADLPPLDPPPAPLTPKRADRGRQPLATQPLATQPRSASALAKPASKRVPANDRWESPWFVVGVGGILGLIAVGLGIAARILWTS